MEWQQVFASVSDACPTAQGMDSDSRERVSDVFFCFCFCYQQEPHLKFMALLILGHMHVFFYFLFFIFTDVYSKKKK